MDQVYALLVSPCLLGCAACQGTSVGRHQNSPCPSPPPRQVRKLRRPVSLDELKTHKEGALSCMHLFKYGRLSVQAVAPTEWDFVLGLEEQEAPGGGPQGGQGEGKPKGRAKAAGKAAGRGKKAAGEDGAAAAAAAAEDGAAAAAADGEGPAELEQPALANKKKRGRAAK